VTSEFSFGRPLGDVGVSAVVKEIANRLQNPTPVEGARSLIAAQKADLVEFLKSLSGIRYATGEACK